MAKINGLELKKVNTFIGNEGPTSQGNLYLDGKKIAFWSQDSWGGISDILYMENGFSEDKLREKILELNKDKSTKYDFDYDLEFLACDLLELKESEKTFKSVIKKGYSGILFVSGNHTDFYIALPKTYTEMSLEELKNNHKIIESIKNSSNDIDSVEIKLYKSLDDFNIGESIGLNNIKE